MFSHQVFISYMMQIRITNKLIEMCVVFFLRYQKSLVFNKMYFNFFFLPSLFFCKKRETSKDKNKCPPLLTLHKHRMNLVQNKSEFKPDIHVIGGWYHRLAKVINSCKVCKVVVKFVNINCKYRYLFVNCKSELSKSKFIYKL